MTNHERSIEGLEANLTQAEAEARATRVSDVSYSLDLDLEAGAEDFSGRVTIRFTTRPGEGPVFVDLLATRLDQATLDGEALPEEAWEPTRLHLPEAGCAPGEHTLELAFASRYGRDGTGFHRFVDPEDGGEYVYTNSEPYFAHRAFPCFDQPDLKASFALAVTAPAAWEVVSNLRETSKLPVEDGRTRWVFPETPRFSTYLFNVTAGPYRVWEDPGARIPSRVLCRPGLAEFMDAEAVFATTRRGFDFYEAYFEVPYPFAKYDQVFAPEFMTGAMENVGAVLINDSRYLFRHAPSEDDRLERDMVILHEMAHMWFGNLVTMRWWDGLWLNESFATYMSFLAVPHATEHETGWVYFDQKIRAWAMWQDELSTTHPIENPVPETKGCFSNFDGITYGKGCCVLKQLAFRLGAETFRKGVASYLQRHAWGNTSNHDFLQALADEADMDLDAWSQEWLHASGVNTLRCHLVREGERVTGVRLEQEPGNGDARLRTHELELAVFCEEGDQHHLTAHEVEIQVSGPETVVELPELPGPALLVHPNIGGHGYLKLDLDRASLAFLERHLSRIEDPATRSGLVDVTRQMVRDAEVHPVDFLRGTLRELAHEHFAPILETFSAFVPVVLTAYLGPAQRGPLADRLQAMALGHLEDPALGAEEKRPWFRLLVGSAFRDEALAVLHELLGEARSFPGLELDVRRRWSLVDRLVWAGHPEGEALLEAEEARDGSDVGKLRALGIRSSIPSAASKAAAWEVFLEDGQLSLEQQKAAFGGFHRPGQAELLEPYRQRFLDELPGVAARRNQLEAIAFVQGLYPRFDESEELPAATEALLEGGDLEAGVLRALRESLDDLRRYQRIRAKAREPRVIQ